MSKKIDPYYNPFKEPKKEIKTYDMVRALNFLKQLKKHLKTDSTAICMQYDRHNDYYTLEKTYYTNKINRNFKK